MTPRRATDNLSVRAQRDLARLLSRVAWVDPRNSASFPSEGEQDGVGGPTPSCLVRSAKDFGRARAEDMRDDILRRCRMIEAGQGLGHLRSDLAGRRALRFWPLPPFVIVYDVKTRLVVRVLHGRRDIPAVLR